VKDRVPSLTCCRVSSGTNNLNGPISSKSDYSNGVGRKPQMMQRSEHTKFTHPQELSRPIDSIALNLYSQAGFTVSKIPLDAFSSKL
jgi:hypothetical protein